MSQATFLLTAVLGVLSAVLTGAITHVKAPSQVKAAVLLSFSIVSGAIVQAVHTPFTWQSFATAALVAAGSGFVAHKGDFIAFLTGPNGLITKMIPGGLGAPTAPKA